MYMKIAMAIAGGFVVAYRVSKKLLKHNATGIIQRKFGAVVGALSVIPALFISTVIGGNLGGGYGEAVSRSLGLRSAGIPIGLAIGLFTIIVLVMWVFTFIGIIIGGVVNDFIFKRRST